MQEFGNRRAALVWEATLPSNFRRPSASDGYSLEKFIRAKYVNKQFYQKKTREELDKASTRPSEKVQPKPIIQVEGNTKRLSSPVTRQPNRRPPSRSPPTSDGLAKLRPPQVDLLSNAVNLLSLDSTQTGDAEFGAFTPPVVPIAEHQKKEASPSIPCPQQAAKDSIMGLFEPASPLAAAYNFYHSSMSPAGYQSPCLSPAIHHQQQQLYHPYYVASPQGYSSPSQYYQQPVGIQQQQYYVADMMSPSQQWGGGFGSNDPIMQQIQTLKQNSGGTPSTGLATLLM